MPAIVLWWWHWDSVNVRVQSGVNDDVAAVAMLLSVVKAAKTSLVIRDDGNKAPATVYDDERVIDTVRSQLADNEGLNIRCLFNDRDDLELVRQITAEYPARFKVWYTDGPRLADDIHYKIADGGAVGHLSWHEHKQPERDFKLLDCSAAKRRTRKRAFGQYLKQFEADVAAAANPIVGNTRNVATAWASRTNAKPTAIRRPRLGKAKAKVPD